MSLRSDKSPNHQPIKFRILTLQLLILQPPNSHLSTKNPQPIRTKLPQFHCATKNGVSSGSCQPHIVFGHCPGLEWLRSTRQLSSKSAAKARLFSNAFQPLQSLTNPSCHASKRSRLRQFHSAVLKRRGAKKRREASQAAKPFFNHRLRGWHGFAVFFNRSIREIRGQIVRVVAPLLCTAIVELVRSPRRFRRDASSSGKRQKTEKSLTEK